jgi:hypothetical protein
MIETGRYTKPFTPRANRTCPLCNDGSLEDEVHFLLDCPSYEPLRRSCILDPRIIPECFNQLNPDQQTVFLMSSEGSLIKHIALFCSRAFALRQSTIINIQP